MASNRIYEVKRAWMQALKPPKKLKVSEWADNHRKLSPEAAAEPGQWRTSRAEYQRGMMDALNDPNIHTIVFMTSSQVGKSELLLNMLAYHVHLDPCPILFLQPTLEVAEAFSKDRIATMIRDTSVISELFEEAKAKKTESTIRHKKFKGGHITMAGANSPASLASRPIRIVFADEIDRYPRSAGTEGDPLSLAEKRTTTFWNRKQVRASTPTIEGISRIEHDFKNSDQRYYYVSCPHCDMKQRLIWSNIRWYDNDPNTTVYVCEYCGAAIEEIHKAKMLLTGEWRATAKSDGVAGFHLSELYSPWKTWKEVVKDFLAAKKLPDKLMVFVNTSLGETFKMQGDGLDSNSLLQRVESYGPEVPEQAFLLTAGLDVQKDRLEIQVSAWGPDEEKWVMDRQVFFGDPAQDDVWDTAMDYIQKPWLHESGVYIRVLSVAVDTGGLYTDQAYRYIKTNGKKILHAIKGGSVAGAPFVPTKIPKPNKGGVKLWIVGVDSGKDIVAARLEKIETPGPGFIHFRDTVCDQSYFDGLTAEKAITKYHKGFPYRSWEKKDGAANEPWDLSIYDFAALRISRNPLRRLSGIISDLGSYQKSILGGKIPPTKKQGPSWTSQEEASEDMAEQGQKSQNKPEKRKTPRPRGGWINKWRTP